VFAEILKEGFFIEVSTVTHNSLKKILFLFSWGMGLPTLLIADKPFSSLPDTIRFDGLKMIRVNAGSFTIGTSATSPRSEPYEGLRKVTISKSFYLAETEVTQAIWSKNMKINPSRFQSPSLPVEGITWLEAMDFCDQLNQKKEKFGIPDKMIFRLPSEAEWEYAARASSTTTFFFGEDSKHLTQYAWITDNSEGSTKSVGLLSPNKWGFLDIYGNVREWCLDGYGPRPSGKLVDPMLAWENMDKVNRGGSWDSCDACCKTAKRMNYGANYQSSDIGFRLAVGYPFPQMIKK
jgi:formylglycine-generating enzyme required for sulfatase activity